MAVILVASSWFSMGVSRLSLDANTGWCVSSSKPFSAESRAAWTDFALTRQLHIRDFVDRNVQTQFRSILFLSSGKKKKVKVLSSVTAEKGFCL